MCAEARRSLRPGATGAVCVESIEWGGPGHPWGVRRDVLSLSLLLPAVAWAPAGCTGDGQDSMDPTGTTGGTETSGSTGSTGSTSAGTSATTGTSSGTGSTTATTGSTTGGGSVALDALIPAGERTCAVGTSDQGKVVRCFGRGDLGGLGTGTTEHVGDDEPASDGTDLAPPGTFEGWPAAGPTARHGCATTAGGELRCWGANDRGQLGYGHTQTIGDDETVLDAGPVDVGGAVGLVALGGAHTCAVVDGNAPGVRCWGANDRGQLGLGHTDDIGDDETPASAGPVDLGDVPVLIAAGHAHTCAVFQDGSVRCWGANDRGQLGLGHTSDVGDDETPAQVAAVPLPVPVDFVNTEFNGLAVGRAHTCVVGQDQKVYCWGANGRGQLGYGHTEDVGDDETLDTLAPVELGGIALAVGAGADFTCASVLVQDANETGLRCWGANDRGQLGLGHTNDVGDDETPAQAGPVPILGGPPAVIRGGRTHVCILSDYFALCWGGNGYGQLGYGDTLDRGGTPGTTPDQLPFPQPW